MNEVEREAQRIIDVAGAQDQADVVAAYYLRLRLHKVPAAAALDFTMAEMFPSYGWSDIEEDY